MSNSSRWRITESGQPSEWREPATFTSAGDSGNDTGHLAEIVDFLAAIREGSRSDGSARLGRCKGSRRPAPTPDRSTRSNIFESAKSMALYEAIRDSAATGRVVTPAATSV